MCCGVGASGNSGAGFTAAGGGGAGCGKTGFSTGVGCSNFGLILGIFGVGGGGVEIVGGI
jgi:hypothetical protein